MARSSLKNVCRLIEEVKRDIPVEKSFLADLKTSIELTDEKNLRLPSKTYKPSSMNCIRNMWYQVTGTPLDSRNSSYCLVGICESGTDRHERIQNAVSQMKTNNIDCEYVDVGEYVTEHNLDYLEIKSKKGNETHLYHKVLNMSFLCDGIIKYKGNYYILEIKTESIYKWQSRNDVAEEHKMQGTAYSTALGIDNVLFLYANRDNTDMKTFMFNVTDTMKHDFVGLIEQCDEYVRQLKCPPKPLEVPKKACEYCLYRTRCTGDV